MAVIEDFESRFVLGNPAMDRQHREMVELVNRMDDASNATFVYLFPDLLNHTRAHFAAEEALMRETRFPAIAEHRDEHARVLGEMERFGARLREGRLALARAYIHEQLPAWFALHAITMDSALAGHVKGKPPG